MEAALPSTEKWTVIYWRCAKRTCPVFGTQENLLKLSELDTIYVDGTFSTCPSLFRQLFTINGFVGGQQFPLVYGFLPNKSRADYNRFFTIVKQEMQNSGLTLQPSAVMEDFELTLIQAVELQFPSTRIMGCYFHFSQCLWRKVQALGFATAYSSDATVKCFIHKTAALSFVPVTFLRVAWSAIKANSTKVQMIQVATKTQEKKSC